MRALVRARARTDASLRAPRWAGASGLYFRGFICCNQNALSSVSPLTILHYGYRVRRTTVLVFQYT